MLDGRDLLGTAQTGTGKTASFVLPILNRIHGLEGMPKPKTARALILAPTRELAAQIAENVSRYGQFMKAKTAVVVGGVKPGPQVRAMARGVDLLVATPGRLLDHMSTGAIRLDETSIAVLDEADQMLDLGFMPAIRRVMRALPQERQTVLLSATMPKQIRGLAQDFLRDPAEIAVAPASRPIERIDQKVFHVSQSAKRGVLIDLLKDADLDRAVVFTRTKRGADKVSRHLDQAGLASAAIHGNKSQGQRDRALGAFRNGSVRILVATDIAARGIDVDGVSHVFNFELPNVPEAYVHRIGRTARAGRSGIAISLCDGAEKSLLRDIEKLIGKRLPATQIGDPDDSTSDEAAPQDTKTSDRPRKADRPRQDAGARRRRNEPRRDRNHRDQEPRNHDGRNQENRNQDGRDQNRAASGKPAGNKAASGRNVGGKADNGARQNRKSAGRKPQGDNTQRSDNSRRPDNSRRTDQTRRKAAPARRAGFAQPGPDAPEAGLERMLGVL